MCLCLISCANPRCNLAYLLILYPFKYPGLPLGVNPRTTSMWVPSLEAEKKLASWKENLTFLWRPQHLNKSTCLNFVFILPLFKVPLVVANNLENDPMGFPLGWKGGQKKSSLSSKPCQLGRKEISFDKM